MNVSFLVLCDPDGRNRAVKDSSFAEGQFAFTLKQTKIKMPVTEVVRRLKQLEEDRKLNDPLSASQFYRTLREMVALMGMARADS